MEKNLINRRDDAMDRADRALDAVWPERKGVDYVREMQSVSKELEEAASAMRKEDIKLFEQSRTYRYLGSVYSDLAPALGKEMLLKARDSYIKAETLLKGYDDKLEHAKLNFNFANTLRQMGLDNIEQLQEAKRRFLFAKKIFAVQQPQYKQQVETALLSVESLLKFAPLVSAVDRNYTEMEALKEDLKSGGNLSDIIRKMSEVITRDGGISGLIGKVQTLLDDLPNELKQSKKYSEIQQKMSALTELVIGGSSTSNQDAQITKMLRIRLEDDLKEGKVSEDRAETMRGIIGKLGTIRSDDDVQGIQKKIQQIRDYVEASFDTLHYLSHGIPRPPSNSRAAELVENCWILRRFLMEEMNRSGKGPEESKELLDLNKQAARVDKRIYETGADNEQAKVVDKEEFRPLAKVVRSFSARSYLMLSQPIWPVAHITVDTNAVFYSGSIGLQGVVTDICHQLGLTIMPTPSGESFAKARWKQIQKAIITVFDLGFEDGPIRASVAYELGIALTFGKPIVVIATKDHPLPFDVDVPPVILSGDQNDEKMLTSAIDRSITWTYYPTRSKDFLVTLDYILSKYSRPYPDMYVDQTLRLLADQKKDPDPLSINRAIKTFVDFLKDGSTMPIYPIWSPVYPKDDHLRLFHVMPYSPKKWADEVTLITRRTCETRGVNYVRGDEVEDPNVIRSIWEEIAQANHVVVDLTGFSANVSLELGIAHTVGRPCLLVGQGNILKQLKQLFPMIARLRFKTYKDPTDLEALVGDFLER